MLTATKPTFASVAVAGRHDEGVATVASEPSKLVLMRLFFDGSQSATGEKRGAGALHNSWRYLF